MKECMILFRVSVYFRVFRGWTLFADMNRSVAEPAGSRQRRAGAQFQIEDPWLGVPEPGRWADSHNWRFAHDLRAM